MTPAEEHAIAARAGPVMRRTTRRGGVVLTADKWVAPTAAVERTLLLALGSDYAAPPRMFDPRDIDRSGRALRSSEYTTSGWMA